MPTTKICEYINFKYIALFCHKIVTDIVITYKSYVICEIAELYKMTE